MNNLNKALSSKAGKDFVEVVLTFGNGVDELEHNCDLFNETARDYVLITYYFARKQPSTALVTFLIEGEFTELLYLLMKADLISSTAHKAEFAYLLNAAIENGERDARDLDVLAPKKSKES